MSDEQMRVRPLRYPVDRYLVESSKMFEMINIIDDEVWNPEPALRPEDEIILRKLHDMLQTTADDLKELSKEILKFHEPGVQIKTEPTPLDEEFNEKVHIEEVVNAKFHGYKMVDTKHVPEIKLRNDTLKPINTHTAKIVNTGAQISKTIRPIIKQNLEISRTRIIQINDSQDSSKNKKLNNGMVYKEPTVAYNEFCYKHVEPAVKHVPQKLKVQDMPCINIRSELKEQKVLQLDIVPDSDHSKQISTYKSNVSVVTIRYDIPQEVSAKQRECVNIPLETYTNSSKTARKISKMSTFESSGSTSNISSDAQVKLNTQKRIITSIKNSPKTSARSRNIKKATHKNEQWNRARSNLDEWKHKLNIVYGSSNSKKTKPLVTPIKKQANFPKPLNNTEYIPYSRFTIGGVRASDIEREISDLPNKNDITLSPILDKIMSSRDNSFHKENPRNRVKDSQNILTASDENLLQEVLDIEKTVSETLSQNLKKNINEPFKSASVSSGSSIEKINNSYVDDFEEEKSDRSYKAVNRHLTDDHSSDQNSSVKSNLSEMHRAPSSKSDDDRGKAEPGPSNKNKDTTYTKTKLSLKDSVDVFECIHSVAMQDTATQSNCLNIIPAIETQTSPVAISDTLNMQPAIHNDLWPSIDPRREVEKMFEIEKDFIKKIILDEYGDLLEKNIKKPSISNENEGESTRNYSAIQKNTQTSPARVKSVMTSPKRTKTRTTSPFNLSVPVHQQTSPIIRVTDEVVKIDVTNEADDISVNLSSPRFSLRLPQNSREVFSNLDAHSRASSRKSATKISINDKLNNNSFRKTTVSSSSVDADNSSSEHSSLGEIRMKRLRRRVLSVSECSSSSVVSKYSCDFQSMGVLPLRSEGEVSSEQAMKRAHIMPSEGETSLEPL